MNTITIHDVSTNKIIQREMNAEELAQHEIDKSRSEAEQIALKEIAAEKAALLAKLGITEDEAKLLLG